MFFMLSSCSFENIKLGLIIGLISIKEQTFERSSDPCNGWTDTFSTNFNGICYIISQEVHKATIFWGR